MKIEHECSEAEAHLVREINQRYAEYCESEGLPMPPPDNQFYAVLVAARLWYHAVGERYGPAPGDKLN